MLEALNEELHKRSTLPPSVVTMIDSLPKEPAAVVISSDGNVLTDCMNYSPHSCGLLAVSADMFGIQVPCSCRNVSYPRTSHDFPSQARTYL